MLRKTVSVTATSSVRRKVLRHLESRKLGSCAARSTGFRAGIHGRPGSQVVGHLRLFTARALRSMLPAAGFEVVRITGAPYHDVPRPFRPLDRAACHTPSLASILLVHARAVRRPGPAEGAG